MAAVSDFEHLTRAPASLLRHVEQWNDDTVEQLQTSGSTVLVNALRTCPMSRTIIAVGTIGVFEALLQRHLGWKDAFVELDKTLRDKGQADLADRFKDFRDAINVLKHGEGKSYERLLSRKDQLTFNIMERGEAFFEEGDVSEVARLIAVDGTFIDRSITIIDEIGGVLGLEA